MSPAGANLSESGGHFPVPHRNNGRSVLVLFQIRPNGKGFAMGDKGGKKDKDKSQKQKAAKVATKQKGGKPAK